MEIQSLRERAARAIENCHCPYSDFRVAAVVEDGNGILHTGVNVENASLGLTVCAERNAIFGAVCRGIREFRRILVYSPDGFPLPCGACLQVMMEFCQRDMQVIVADQSRIQEYALSDLLPHPFGGGC
jgi:cytidine deaminase